MEIIPQLAGMLIGCFVWSLAGAVFLRAAAKWVQKLDVGFGHAYITVLLSAIINLVFGLIVGIGIGAALGFFVSSYIGIATHFEAIVNAAYLLMIPVGLLIQSGIISLRLRIPFARGCLISLAMIVIAFAILLVISILMLIIGAVI